MNIDKTELRNQLAPGWTGVNIALMVILFLLWWPFGLLMIAYILGGRSIGLDLGRPETFSGAFGKISTAFGAGLSSFKQSASSATGTPDHERESFEQWRNNETEKLKIEREALEKDKARFEAEKKSAE